MKTGRNRQKVLGVALILALLGTMVIGSASSLAMADVELLANGGFEGGFVQKGGCGMVGKGWGCFTNGGTVDYGFYDDQWAPVVADGKHSQLIELNTMQYAASQPDRYAGIFQTVKTVKGAAYTLKIKGLIRERNPDPSDDPWRYRVQWGYTADGSTDWTHVAQWVELPWDKIYERTAPAGFESFSTTFKAPSGKLTLFIRVWKKWGSPYKELDVNLDAISLVGKGVKPVVEVKPVVGAKPVAGGAQPAGGVVVVGKPAKLTCGGSNLLANGNFEGGFVNGVGKGWSSFTNGGAAAYGFYDEMWAPVIVDGKHGQLIEINTWCRAASDPDRYAGIYQVVGGLHKNGTYQFSLSGLMRESAQFPEQDNDKYRYRVQWGYAAADADPSADDITNWTELPWDAIYPRTSPGAMLSFSTRFTVPADKIVLAVRAWKKWGTVQRELDVNLDVITLLPCAGTPVPPNGDGCAAWYVVKKGDTLSKIAAHYRVTVAAIVKLNKIKNPNVIFPGQKLCIPPDP